MVGLFDCEAASARNARLCITSSISTTTTNSMSPNSPLTNSPTGGSTVSTRNLSKLSANGIAFFLECYINRTYIEKIV